MFAERHRCCPRPRPRPDLVLRTPDSGLHWYSGSAQLNLLFISFHFISSHFISVSGWQLIDRLSLASRVYRTSHRNRIGLYRARSIYLCAGRARRKCRAKRVSSVSVRRELVRMAFVQIRPIGSDPDVCLLADEIPIVATATRVELSNSSRVCAEAIDLVSGRPHRLPRLHRSAAHCGPPVRLSARPDSRPEHSAGRVRAATARAAAGISRHRSLESSPIGSDWDP